MNSERILLVDDDAGLRDLLSRYLAREGFEVKVAAEGGQARRALDQGHFDLIVLDLMLPGEDGLSLLKRWRVEGVPTPVIMLTAKGDEVDRIVGLELGADDYLPKPCNPRELLARVRAVLRRASATAVPGAPGEADEMVHFGRCSLDLATRSLICAGVVHRLTSGDFALLGALVRHPRVPLTRDRLISLARGRDSDPFERSVDVAISKLRRLIEDDPKAPRHIQTVWGHGYVFVPTERGTSPRRGWRTVHLLLAALLGFLFVLTTVTLLLLRNSAMQPSVRQLALPLMALVDQIDASDTQDAGQVRTALVHGIVRAPGPPPATTLVPVPFLGALVAYLREHSGREVSLERAGDGTTRLWLTSARGDWIGVPLEPLRSLVARFALLFVVLAIGLAVLAAWWLARRLAQPIERLATVAGRLPEPVDASEFRVRGPREVQLLGDRLAEALERIDAQRRERDLMLAGLSHDLRTPLMRLLLRVDLLDAIPESERAAINADISELDRRIDRFIEHARTGAEEPRTLLDLVPLLHAEADASRGRGHPWQVELPLEARLLGQPGVLRRLIANLIDNAEQHGVAPFRITLGQERGEPGTADVWRLRIDNAIGDTRLAEGTELPPHRGFGLALCRHIALTHGGSLDRGIDANGHWVELRLPMDHSVSQA